MVRRSSRRSKSKKLRTRSENELDRRAVDMAAFRDVMTEVGIPFWLGGGSLLGAVRDGDFIPWDWDVEMHVRGEEAFPVRKRIMSTAQSAGFVIDQRMTKAAELAGFKVSLRRPGGTRIGLLAFSLSDKGSPDLRYRLKPTSYCGPLGLTIPDRLFVDDADTVTLRGETFPAHTPGDEYCEWAYGPSWRTPMRSGRKAEYMSSQFRAGR